MPSTSRINVGSGAGSARAGPEVPATVAADGATGAQTGTEAGDATDATGARCTPDATGVSGAARPVNAMSIADLFTAVPGMGCLAMPPELQVPRGR
ncbi:MAG: hypothetical protein JNJ89_06350 [Rubrivivax sp.]|nr:hypothetical protein [Rubrivivax sp.]